MWDLSAPPIGEAPGRSYAVGLLWLVFAEMGRHPGHKQTSPVSKLPGSRWRQVHGRSFFLPLLPSIYPLSKFVANLCFTCPCCLGSVKINNSPTSTTLGVWDQHTSVRWYDIIILSCVYTSSLCASKYKATDGYGWGREGVYRELKDKSP